MSSLIHSCRSYLYFFIVVFGLFSSEACGDRYPENTKSKQGDTTASIVISKKEMELDTTGYKVFQSIKPQMRAGCKQVTMYLLEDARLGGLTAEIHYYPAYHAAQMIFQSDGNILNPDNPGYKPAILLTKGNDGTIISYTILDVPCARIDTEYLDENKDSIVYLFTLDYSTGMGSYNGPVSYFVHFTDTGMVNFKGDNGFAITLKSAWAMRYTEHLEVWSKICRPTDDGDFSIITKKCYWDADSFKSVTAVKKGIWEDEGDTSMESLREFFDNFSQ